MNEYYPNLYVKGHKLLKSLNENFRKMSKES